MNTAWYITIEEVTLKILEIKRRIAISKQPTSCLSTLLAIMNIILFIRSEDMAFLSFSIF